MYYRFVVVALNLFTAAFAAVDFSSPISSLVDELKSLDSKVRGWSPAAGLAGALNIQEALRPVSEAVGQLSSAIATAPMLDDTDARTAVNQFGVLTSVIIQILADLSTQVNEFREVGAAPIVARDLRSLDPEVANIVGAVYSKIPPLLECSLVSAASSIGVSISAAFADAGSVYGEQIANNFPVLHEPCVVIATSLISVSP